MSYFITEYPIKNLIGYSGSKVVLMTGPNGPFVRKTGDVIRNIERMHVLKNLGFKLPEILRQTENEYDMEYLSHQNMSLWLARNSPSALIEFLLNCFDTLSKTEFIHKDYTNTYYTKLQWIDTDPWKNLLPFNLSSFIKKLPKVFPASCYHGDLTLENILYTDRGFAFIDPLTSEYDSWYFDVAKLRQDLECGWFIRHQDHSLSVKLQSISRELGKTIKHYDDPFILMAMLLRILPYATHSQDTTWILKEIHRLWK